MGVDRGQTFGVKVLSLVDFHTVRLTVFDILYTSYFAGTAVTVPISKKARIEYDGACTFDGEGISIVYLSTVSPTIW